MSDSFVNPYTFVPLKTEEPQREKQDNSGKDTLSGHIDLTITLRKGSPLFIPNTTKAFADADKPEHKHRVFYSYRDLSGESVLTKELREPEHPVIPGSELRGMVRSLYEQLTNSCFSVIDENNLPYKRTNEPKKLCIMKWSEKRQGWLLYPDVKENNEYFKGAILPDNDNFYLSDNGWDDAVTSEKISRWYGNALNAFENEVRVRFDLNNGDLDPDSRGKYYLHIPPLMPGKKPDKSPTANKCIVYTADGLPDAAGVPVPADALMRFEQVLGIVPDIKGGYLTSVNQNEESGRVYERYKKMYRNKLPLIVYADKNSFDKGFPKDAVVYLAPAAMSKEFFSNTIQAILEKNKKHQPCRDRSCLCPACRLFGMIGDNGAAAGKLRFADAPASGAVRYGEEQTLPILGTPKISSTEFYLRKPVTPDPDIMWNYDYYTTYRGQGRNTEFIRHPYTPVPAGRKVYWNRSFSARQAEKTKMNATVTPILSGTFTERIYFDRISREELERLLFCLCPTGSEDFCHKLGGGKPLGMGQVYIGIDRTVCERYVVENGEIIRKPSEYEHDEALRETVGKNAAVILRSGKDLPADQTALIDYPRPGNSEDIFKWFQKNRGSVNAPVIQSVLPDYYAVRQTLPKNHDDGNRTADRTRGGNGNFSSYNGRKK